MTVKAKAAEAATPVSTIQTKYVLAGAVVVLAFLAAYVLSASARTASASGVSSGSATQSTGAYAQGGSGAGAYPGGGSTGGSGAGTSSGNGYPSSTAPGGTSAGTGSGAGGGCCGGGGSQTTVKGQTTPSGGVQKVTIDLTTGSYSPNQITAKAGVPIELDFKGPATGCNGYVVSQQLGFSQDMSNGGTIQVPALKAGTYQWTCSMGMYTGQLIVK